jgi:hypothetical protein
MHGGLTKVYTLPTSALPLMDRPSGVLEGLVEDIYRGTKYMEVSELAREGSPVNSSHGEAVVPILTM